jgi:septal ring factor EnvC (AmiA/AmiB activator)
MGTNRKESGEEQQAPPRPGIALAAETLRSAASSARGEEELPRGEARISMFWRVFGGTLLSIAALVCMTVYQQFSSSLSDLRAAVNHVNELQADVLKKDELNTRTNAIWAALKELDNDVPSLKTRAAIMESELKTAAQERKELCVQVQTLRERLASLEARQTGSPRAKAGPPDIGGAH